MESFFVDLAHLDLLAVKGEGSGKFLQGQLTCDIEQAAGDRCLNGAACNNKGRVLSSFLLLRQADDFYLEMKPGLLAGSKAHLDKYIVFYKATTGDAGGEFRRYGLSGPAAEDFLAGLFPALPASPGALLRHEGHLLLRRPGVPEQPPRYELWLETAGAAGPAAALAAALPQGGPDDWEALDLRQGLYYLEQRDSEQYTPQALNYDINGFVSFTKGCYTGQEIVARMYYRGQAKKRSYPFRLDGEPGKLAALSEASPLLTGDGKRAGDLIKSLRHAGGIEGLALLDRALAESDESLTLGEHGPVRILHPALLKTGSS